MSTTTNITTITAGPLSPIERLRHGYVNLAAHGARIQALVSRAHEQGIKPLEAPAVRQALRAGIQALVEVNAARLPRLQPRTA